MKVVTDVKNTFISTINEITKYGLQPDLNIPDREQLLEKHLITIYKLYFEVEFDTDHHNYPMFDKSELPNIRKNIESNFPGFGYYKSVVDINDMTNFTDIYLGDAIDDLNDIIIDLLEVKWRLENNGLNDGLYHFKLIFLFHTQQHLLDLLNFMKQKTE